jgi:hypothetical protein
MVVRSLRCGLMLLGVSEMTVEFWILGVLVFWVVAYFTIMKYEDLGISELIILMVLSVAPYVNFIASVLLVILYSFTAIKRKYGTLAWKNRKFVWVKDVETKE